MDYSKLEKAKVEARRFLEAAAKVKVAKYDGIAENRYIESHLKENGSCLRASLDLTRALAELRKG